ncbi:hypothetical protein [Nocardioides aurantiacus]|uniref:hypothetical protein n=1 Tax=Nocardioides aurantiacus TaxID=86796 RepID=UPI000F47CD8E|nr:hypothetical protein [Nocardioides aurantiacus]
MVVFKGDGDWLSHAAQAIYECGRVWGGSGFILIPHHNGSVLPALVRLAAAFDPDYVLNAQTTIGQHEAIYPGDLRVNRDNGEMMVGEQRTNALRHSFETRIPDPAARAARDLIANACTPHRYMIPQPDGSEEAHEQLHVLSLSDDRFGGHQPLSRAPVAMGGETRLAAGVPGDIQGLWGLAAAVHFGLCEPPALPFADASPVSFEVAKSVMRRALPSRRRSVTFSSEGAAWNSAWAMSESGTVRVQPWQASRKHNLVVVGRSADDFALAQGWHVQFGNSYWIPEQPPIAKKVADQLLWGLGQDMLSETEYRDRKAVLTSATLDEKQLQAIADGWVEKRVRVFTSWVDDDGETVTDQEDEKDPPAPRVMSPDGLDFTEGGVLVVRDQYDVPLALPATTDEHGQIELLVDLPPLAPAHPDLDSISEVTWQIDVDTADFKGPRMRGTPPHILQHGENAREFFVRSSRNGLSCYSASWGLILAGSTRTQAMAKPRLQFPSVITWTGAMAAANGFSTRFSPAGQRVEILRRLWGGRLDLMRAWSGPLRPVLLAFHTNKKRTSDAFPAHDGVVLQTPDAYLSFAGMARLYGAVDQAIAVELRGQVDHLCALGVLRRGLILRCGSCLVFNFITVDDLRSTNACHRCGAANPMSHERWGIPLDEPTWWYDLHPAARELLAADAGVGLLAADYLRRKGRAYDDVSELEFLRGNDPVAEADLLAVVDGRIILGEAKATPKLGTRSERAAKARKLATIATAVRADELLLCTTSASEWSTADIAAITDALGGAIPNVAMRPLIRTITRLGSTPVEG